MLDRFALIVVDVQKGSDDPYWGRRNNPACENNVSDLIAAWREAHDPVVFVRHDSVTEDSPLAPQNPGNNFKDVEAGDPDLLVSKSVNSAFLGHPDLHSWLRSHGITGVVICGIQTNFCAETTARMAGNLGYDTFFVLDATHTFDLPALDGSKIKADELMRVTAAILNGELATVATTVEILKKRTEPK